jgi:drug/metabolite transporter (DMT)-like permease
MTPLYGVVLGGLILGETIEAGFLYGSAMVIAGIVLVSGHGWIKQLLTRRRVSLNPTVKPD